MARRLGAMLVVVVIGSCGDAQISSGDVDADVPSEVEADVPSDVEVASVAPMVLGAWPSLADPSGGGGRVVIALDRSEGAIGATLGGIALADFAVDDATHVSGVPGAHEPGVVDVVVTTATNASEGGAGRFEYWSPAQIAEVDLFVESDLIDRGPKQRVLSPPDGAAAPTVVPRAMGSSAALRFAPGQLVRLAEPSALPEGSSIFAVAAWTATTDVTPPPGNLANVPLTIVGDMTNGYGAFGASGGAVMSNHYVGGPVYVSEGHGLNDGRARIIGASVDPLAVAKIYVGNTQVGVDHDSAPLAGQNSWDAIGAGIGGDGFEGDVGAVVIVAGVLATSDRERLDRWSEQRFGTPRSQPLDAWERRLLGTMPESWVPRDGSQAVALESGRVLVIGGWNPRDLWGEDGATGARVTNEIWKSDDSGESWQLLLPHDESGSRFPPGHTVGVTAWKGHAVVLGSDCLRPPLLGDVWRESDDGVTWTRISESAPTAGRCLFMTATLGDDLYVMGGQTNLYDASTAIADVWRSSDGGETWDPLAKPPWSGRGMVYRPAAIDGRLFVVGGGAYADAADTPPAYNGVYAFDGANWQTILPDGNAIWQPSYYNAVAALDGRLWLFNGFTGTDELCRTLVSDDQGLTWHELPGGSGGDPSHADAVVSLPDRILRISGNLSENRVYAFMRR